MLLAAHLSAALYLLWQVSGAVRPATLFQPALVGRMLRYGAELWIAVLLLVLLGRIGFWIVSWQLGEDALGLYFGAQRLGEILVEVATAVGIVIFSYGVRATDTASSALDAIRIARLVTALMALVALVALLFARSLLGLVLGPEFAAETDAFRLVMVGALANSYTTMLYPCLSAQGLARWGIGAFAIGSAVAAVAFYVLTPTLGLTGAGLAYGLAQAAAMAVDRPCLPSSFRLHAGRNPPAAAGGCASAVANHRSAYGTGPPPLSSHPKRLLLGKPLGSMRPEPARGPRQPARSVTRRSRPFADQARPAARSSVRTSASSASLSRISVTPLPRAWTGRSANGKIRSFRLLPTTARWSPSTRTTAQQACRPASG